MPLIEKLKNLNTPLEITIDEGIIEASNVDYGDKYDVSIIFNHPEGEIEIGYDYPTRREQYDFDNKDFEKLNYEQKRLHYLKEIQGTDELNEDECPWIIYDRETQQYTKESDCEEAMNKWLDEKYGSNEYELESLLDTRNDVSEYAPGFEIYEALSNEERQSLGLRIAYTGHPASSWQVVFIDCNADQLNQVLREKKLPFIVP